MEIQEHRQGAVTVLAPKGPLIADEIEAFAERAMGVSRESLGRMVLDATSIPFVDSAGLEALVSVSELLSEAGQSLKICGANDTIREVLELTDLGDLFEHYEDAASAARSFV